MTRFSEWRDHLSQFIVNQHDEKFKILLIQELQLVDDILAVHLQKPPVVDDHHSPGKKVESLSHGVHEEVKEENVVDEGPILTSSSCNVDISSHDDRANETLHLVTTVKSPSYPKISLEKT